ncbi:CGNR zinc finger domain-containing protein [Actinoplanes sp. NEAU-A12]|uniref:CGNR zinc finger domain-containing protein n=1 Tax=Actinoplanes sandaracinus TaxID=3045177 RepID=A0ABT6WPM3_9ACTN|nr:CGNR zinc finger domain-containing protein [Actinoplanes sandaracinus]MDI6101679.1 CGNR zinc finger domain-containing protein [Actinoplanes sandaracinus]
MTTPVLGEPIAIEFANTLHAVRGKIRDGLSTSEGLTGWMRAMGERLPFALPAAAVDDAVLGQARELRNAIRAIADALANNREPTAADMATLNAVAGQAPRWRELRWAPQPHTVDRSAGPPAAAVLSALADEAIALFAGEARQELRACHGPGCVLHFVRDTPRREWCSPGCGNRARAARHYARTKRTS